jgi:2-methylisocitrate lyase-like PEP mutase family enzyme
MLGSPGARLRHQIAAGDITPIIGVYDVFSATIAARHFGALFVSGFGFAASHYGLPDLGYVAWPDIVQFVQRLRAVLPEHHVLVDIDDGYGDPDVAGHVVGQLEALGASGVVLEDQRRPRRCGHLSGKQLLELDRYLEKLHRVLATRRELVVIARTDAEQPEEVARRVRAFAQAGADAVLVDGLRDLDLIPRLAAEVDCPFTFNQIAGGRSPAADLDTLRSLGVALVIYSTPCLFAAQEALETALRGLRARNGRLEPVEGGRVGVRECTELLRQNREQRIFTAAVPAA